MRTPSLTTKHRSDRAHDTRLIHSLPRTSRPPPARRAPRRRPDSHSTSCAVPFATTPSKTSSIGASGAASPHPRRSRRSASATRRMLLALARPAHRRHSARVGELRRRRGAARRLDRQLARPADAEQGAARAAHLARDPRERGPRDGRPELRRPPVRVPRDAAEPGSSAATTSTAATSSPARPGPTAARSSAASTATRPSSRAASRSGSSPRRRASSSASTSRTRGSPRTGAACSARRARSRRRPSTSPGPRSFARSPRPAARARSSRSRASARDNSGAAATLRLTISRNGRTLQRLSLPGASRRRYRHRPLARAEGAARRAHALREGRRRGRQRKLSHLHHASAPLSRTCSPEK